MRNRSNVSRSGCRRRRAAAGRAGDEHNSGSRQVTPEMRQADERAQQLAGDLVARAHRAGVLRADYQALWDT
ncbi:hypothetical protein [Nonomuraea fuscirosea]|uniref:hypothetical protein n=1 Tax=Nonomuraea fuscirosea TaxID=1291556 RepID=UPI003407003D